MSNPNPIPRFTKNDPRINRKGRPKSFKALRELVQSVGNEVAKDKNGEPIVIDGHIATQAEMIVRSWTKDPKRQRDFIEYGYGKVPNPVEISGKDGEPIKTDDEGHNRAISKLADALGEIVSRAGTKQDGEVDPAE